jgi:hypothetical protein
MDHLSKAIKNSNKKKLEPKNKCKQWQPNPLVQIAIISYQQVGASFNAPSWPLKLRTVMTKQDKISGLVIKI